MRIQRVLLMITMIAMATACGGGDKDAASSAAPAKDAGAAGGPVTKVGETAAEVTTCLDLVGQESWTAAVDACTKAAGVAPQNSHVQAALKSAQSGVAAATVANAEKAATDKANTAVQDATNGLLDTGK